MKKLLPYLLLNLLLMFTLITGNAVAADSKPLENKKLVVIVKTGDVMEAGMGLALAHSAVKKGAKVTVVLGANAALYPVIKGGQGIFAAKGKTPREMLTAIISDGGTVYLCKTCAVHQGLKQEDLIEGATIVSSIKIFEALYEDGAKSMSF